MNNGEMEDTRSSEFYRGWLVPDMALSDDELASFMQGFLVVTSTFLTGFYVLQWFRGKCAPEAIYVSIITMIVYASALLTGKTLTWVTITGGLEVPLGNLHNH